MPPIFSLKYKCYRTFRFIFFLNCLKTKLLRGDYNSFKKIFVNEKFGIWFYTNSAIYTMKMVNFYFQNIQTNC